MADVVCFGDLLIDFVPTVTGTGLADAPAFVKAPGGAAANVAVGLARLGVGQRLHGQGRRRPVRPFPRRHARSRGRRRRALALRAARPHRAGLRLPARRRRARVPVLPPPQRRHAVHARTRSTPARSGPRASSTSTRSASPPSSPARRRSTPPRWRTRRQADLLRRQPAPAAVARRRGRPGPASARPPRPQVVKLSDDELDFLTGSREPEAVRAALARRAAARRADHGRAAAAVLVTAHGQRHVPSIPVTPVDTTGAGDGFVAGLLAGLLAARGASRTTTRWPGSAASPTPSARSPPPSAAPSRRCRRGPRSRRVLAERTARRAMTAQFIPVDAVRSRRVRRDRRSRHAQAAAGPVPPRQRRPAAAGVPDHRRRPHRADREAYLGQVEAALAQFVGESARPGRCCGASSAGSTMSMSTRMGEDWLGASSPPGWARRRTGCGSATSPPRPTCSGRSAATLAAARARHARDPRRAREAARARSRLGAGDQRRGRPGLRRGADLPDRPLSRQGDGPEPAHPALRQLPVRALVELATRSTTSRSPWPRASGVGERASATTTSPAPCATWCRTTSCSCLCLVAMEPPSAFDADAVRDEKLKVLRALKPIATREVGER